MTLTCAAMPRFSSANLPKNLFFLAAFEELALQAACTPAQLAIAWVVRQCLDILTIPGTTHAAHLTENVQPIGSQINDHIIERAGSQPGNSLLTGPGTAPRRNDTT